MDQHVVAAARRGDTGAFEALVVGHHHRPSPGGARHPARPTPAEDATQQAFLDIWKSIPRLRDPAKFDAWSYRLLIRVCYAEAKRRPDWVPDTDMSLIHAPLAADDYRGVADRDQLERGFRQLSVDHRTVIVLHHLLDMTLETVAETLDIPVGTAHSRLGRAMQALRAAMTQPSHSPTPSPLQQVVR